MGKYDFQYCPKIVVFSFDEKSILLCRRRGEADFNNTFSFIGGKLEITDDSLIEGIEREKNEEVGEDFKIKFFPELSIDLLFQKKDKKKMIIPHHLAIHVDGKIKLNGEYSEYKWVKVEELEEFEPKISSVFRVVKKLEWLRKKGVFSDDDSVVF